MDAASRTGVDDMREVIEATRFRPDAGSHQGLRHRRSPYAQPQRLQRAAENPRRTAAARQIRLRHDGNPQSSDHRPVALPALRPPPRSGRRTVGAVRPHRRPRKTSPSSPPRWSRSPAPPTALSATGCRCWTRRSRRPMASLGSWQNHPAQVVDMLGLADRRGGIRPDGRGDGRQTRRRPGDNRPRVRAWRRPGHPAARPARSAAHDNSAEIRSRPARKPGTARSRTHPGRGTGRPADRADLVPSLADAAERRW